MKGNTFGLMVIVTIIAIIICIAVWIIAAIGAMNLTKGCLYRYNFEEDNAISASDAVSSEVILKANGNYTSSNTTETGTGLTLSQDPNDFGRWVNTKFTVRSGDSVNLTVKGEISLCKSYVPKYNIQDVSETNSQGKRIEIPRVSSGGVVQDGAGSFSTTSSSVGAGDPLPLIMDAKLGEWRNIAEIYPNDYIQVFVSKDRNSTTYEESSKYIYDEKTGNIYVKPEGENTDKESESYAYDKVNKELYEKAQENSSNPLGTIASSIQNDAFNNAAITADCSDGKKEYSPICGRYSFVSGQYVSKCEYKAECIKTNCRKKCPSELVGILCLLLDETEVCDWIPCYENIYGDAPEGYRSDGKYTSPYKENTNAYNIDFNPECRISNSYIDGAYQDQKYFWLSANNAAGLLYRYDTQEQPSNASNIGGGYKQASILPSDGVLAQGSPYKVVMNDQPYKGNSVQYLQFRLYSPNTNYEDHTGGYVLGIKHTKCRRKNGEIIDDTFQGRGTVEYVIAKPGNNPNTSSSLDINRIIPDDNGDATINVPDETAGSIWMRIKNDSDDYMDSFGQYNVTINGKIKRGSFSTDVLDKILNTLQLKIKGASEAIFRNMTCYKFGLGSESSCSNFFNYIRALLILYITIYGILFLIGSVDISQTDIVIRVIKIAIVAGLINEKTYELFNIYVFDFVTNFSDEIIANIGGGTLFGASEEPIKNPLDFLDEVMSKIFFSQTFAAQVLALISLGLSGVLYFIVVLVAIVFCIIAALRALAVYVVAYVAVAVLIGIAPLFLSFILFESTRHLFENWVRFTFRYMIEPVVVLAGLIILTQLFTIYLDMVIGYSVCWKCSLGIQIPFPNIAGLMPALVNVPIFCINWFAPWGHDNTTGPMGISMANIAALLILAYCMKAYVDFAGLLVAKIAGSMGGPSATRMGSAVATGAADRALSPIGMDSKSRAQRSSAQKARLNKMSKANRIGRGKALEGGAARHDVAKGSSGAGQGGAGSPPPLPPRDASYQRQAAALKSSQGAQGGSGAGGFSKPLPKPPANPKPSNPPGPRAGQGASGQTGAGSARKSLPKPPPNQKPSNPPGPRAGQGASGQTGAGSGAARKSLPKPPPNQKPSNPPGPKPGARKKPPAPPTPPKPNRGGSGTSGSGGSS